MQLLHCLVGSVLSNVAGCSGLAVMYWRCISDCSDERFVAAAMYLPDPCGCQLTGVWSGCEIRLVERMYGRVGADVGDCCRFVFCVSFSLLLPC